MRTISVPAALVLLLTLLAGHGTADIATGLVGKWRFSEGTGNSTTADESGNGFTGTLTNMNPATDWVAGKFGTGLAFDGVDGYVDVGQSTTLNPPALTVIAWIKATTFPTYSAVLTRANAGGTCFHQLLVKSTGKLASYVRTLTATVSYDGTGTTTLSAGTLYHVTLTYDSTAGLVGYVNASVDGSAAAQNALASCSGVATTIGTDLVNAGRYFNGVIDEVYIYNRALTSSDVAEHFALTEGRKRRPLWFTAPGGRSSTFWAALPGVAHVRRAAVRGGAPAKAPAR